MTVATVVLAAGGGRRFAASGGRGSKLLADIGGRAVVDLVVEAAVAAGLDEVVVVDGAVDLSGRLPAAVTLLSNRISEPAASEGAAGGAQIPGWEAGLASSLALAVRHAEAVGHDAVVVGLGDQPGVTASAWRAVAEAVTADGLAVATYAGRRGHPVGIGRAHWADLPTTGDEGARRLLAEREALAVEVPCTGDPHDVDTLEDLDRWS